jgi:hypothetical protein
MSVEPSGYCAFNIKKVKGYSDDDFNLVYWLSELYAVKSSVVVVAQPSMRITRSQ